MFTHNITLEGSLYKLEFKYDGRVVKTVYINALDVNWSRSIMEEIQQFYNFDMQKFMRGLGK